MPEPLAGLGGGHEEVATKHIRRAGREHQRRRACVDELLDITCRLDHPLLAVERKAGEPRLRRPVSLLRREPLGKHGDQPQRRMHPITKHTADRRQTKAASKLIEPRADRAIGDTIDEPPLQSAKPGRPAVHLQHRQPWPLEVAAKEHRREVDAHKRDALRFLGNAGPKGEARPADERLPGRLMVEDAAIHRLEQRPDRHIDDRPRAVQRMPDPRIADHLPEVALRQRIDELEARLFDEATKVSGGDDSHSVAAPPQRPPQSDERMHVS